jgi:hypothetical protein
MRNKPTELNQQLHLQLCEADNNFNVIDHLGLNHYEVLQVVAEWYTNGMFGSILQDENGNDLEEIIETEIQYLYGSEV